MRCKLMFVFAVVLFFVGCDENGNLKHDVKGVLSPVDDAFYTGKNVKNFYKIDFYHDYGYATDSFSVEDSEYKVLDSTQLPEGVEFPKDEQGNIISKKRLYFKSVGQYEIALNIRLGLKKLTVSNSFEVKKYPKHFGIKGSVLPSADNISVNYSWNIDVDKAGVWSSSDETVFTVTSTGDKTCELTALKLGTATLIVESEDPDYDYHDEVTVHVGPGLLPAVESVLFPAEGNAGIDVDLVGVLNGSTITFNIPRTVYGDGSTAYSLTVNCNAQTNSNTFPASVAFNLLEGASYKATKSNVFGADYDVEYTFAVNVID